jgi:hypothetical protein
MTDKQKVENSCLSLMYELWGEAPVQALGTVGGREFYFRARHSAWEFEVANEQGDLPSDVGESLVYHRRGEYMNAGFMSKETAVFLIEKCAQEYLESDT